VYSWVLSRYSQHILTHAFKCSYHSSGTAQVLITVVDITRNGPKELTGQLCHRVSSKPPAQSGFNGHPMCDVSSTFNQCTFNVHLMIAQNSLNLYSMIDHLPFNIHGLFTQYSVNVHSIPVQCSLNMNLINALHSLSMTSIQLNMRSIITKYVQLYTTQ
jgi:hypothetical protein